MILSIAVLRGSFFTIAKPIKILVVGAGNGYEVVNYLKHGHDVKGIDLFAPQIPMVRDVTIIQSAEKMPFEDNEFDLVHCTEMLEHVPEEMTEDILNECKRVGKRFVFTIATRGDHPYNTHINIHPAWWWIKKFHDMGFKVITAQEAARLHIYFDSNVSIFSWPDGVFLYGEC